MLAVLFTAVVGLLVLWAETVLVFQRDLGPARRRDPHVHSYRPGDVLVRDVLTSLAKDEAQAYAASIIVGIVLGILGKFVPSRQPPGVLRFVSYLTAMGRGLASAGSHSKVRGLGLISPLVVLGVMSAVFVGSPSGNTDQEARGAVTARRTHGKDGRMKHQNPDLSKMIAISRVNQHRAVGDRRVLFVAAALPIMLILMIGLVSGRDDRSACGSRLRPRPVRRAAVRAARLLRSVQVHMESSV